MMFITSDLLSRYGFWDGDILDFVDEDVITASEWQQLEDRGVLAHELLFETVKQCVVPQLESRVEVCYCVTTHNPVRARVVDGRQVRSDEGEINKGIVISPDAVVVDAQAMRAVVEDLLVTGSKLKW